MTDHPESSDSPDAWSATWQRVRRGEADPEELLVAYLPRLHAFVRARVGAALGPAESRSDIVASVCREFLERGPEFEVRDEPAFRAWLFTAATNKLRQAHRHRNALKRSPAREVRIGEDADVLLARGYASVATPSGEVAAREHVEILEAALERLEPEHREVICHVRLAQLPFAETARLMQRSEGAVRQLLARALVKLSDQLKRAGLGDSRGTG